jgi:hypothetical protein
MDELILAVAPEADGLAKRGESAAFQSRAASGFRKTNPQRKKWRLHLIALPSPFSAARGGAVIAAGSINAA